MIGNSPKFDILSSFQSDPFIGHLSTPVTNSDLVKSYLNFLPAYKAGVSPLLKGINIGLIHGYFLFGPFVLLGPLRASLVNGIVGLISTMSLILILTICLGIYGFVSFSAKKAKTSSDTQTAVTIDFLSPAGWKQLTSGFFLGGLGGASLAYCFFELIHKFPVEF